jgi:uncharacterized Fe-S cluster-containing protein
MKATHLATLLSKKGSMNINTIEIGGERHSIAEYGASIIEEEGNACLVFAKSEIAQDEPVEKVEQVVEEVPAPVDETILTEEKVNTAINGHA